jgi:hypothetical protein
VPPVDGGPRWGVSIIFQPDGEAAEVLDRLTTSALFVVGEEHWATASAGCAHMTVRGLEPHRVPIPDDDPVVHRYASALDRALGGGSAVRFGLAGLLITPISIMLRAAPSDANAECVWSALDRELGADGWWEADYRRDIWYVNLVHFAGPVARPDEVDARVRSRSALAVGEVTLARADLVRWGFDGRRMVPTVLASSSLTG